MSAIAAYLTPDIIEQVDPSLSTAEQALLQAVETLEAEGYTQRHQLVRTLHTMRLRLSVLGLKLERHRERRAAR